MDCVPDRWCLVSVGYQISERLSEKWLIYSIFKNRKNDIQFSFLKNRVPAQAGAGKTIYAFAGHMMYFQFVIARMSGKLCKKRKFWISEAKFYLDRCTFEGSFLAQFLSHIGDFWHEASPDTHLTKCQSAFMRLKDSGQNASLKIAIFFTFFYKGLVTMVTRHTKGIEK